MGFWDTGESRVHQSCVVSVLLWVIAPDVLPWILVRGNGGGDCPPNVLLNETSLAVSFRPPV